MINIPVLRWGEPYESLETEEVIHHRTGEVLASVGQANPGLLARDMRKAARAREALREIPIKDLIEMMKKAGALYLNATLPLGDGEQTPDDSDEIIVDAEFEEVDTETEDGKKKDGKKKDGKKKDG